MTEETVDFPLEHVRLRERVSRRELSPAQADDEARTRGLTPFVQYVTQPAEVLRSLEWWPLALGVVWITRREMSAASQRWAEFKVWKRDLWLNDLNEERHIRLHDAEPYLWRALEGGMIQAVGNESKIKKRIEIPALEWKNMHWNDMSVMGDLHNVYEMKFYNQVEVRKSDLLKRWPDVATGISTSTSVASRDENIMAESATKNKGGRVAVHDWPALGGYLAAYVVDNDYPQKQSEIVEVAIEWFRSARQKTPDKRDIERFVSTMYKSRRISGET